MPPFLKLILNLNLNREAAKISALSSGKNDKDECLTGEEILPSDQRKKQSNFSCTASRKALWKQTKTIED